MARHEKSAWAPISPDLYSAWSPNSPDLYSAWSPNSPDLYSGHQLIKEEFYLIRFRFPDHLVIDLHISNRHASWCAWSYHIQVIQGWWSVNKLIIFVGEFLLAVPLHFLAVQIWSFWKRQRVFNFNGNSQELGFAIISDGWTDGRASPLPYEYTPLLYAVSTTFTFLSMFSFQFYAQIRQVNKT